MHTVSRLLPALLLSCLAVFATTSYAAERGTPQEAKALLSEAVLYMEEVGTEEALAEFNKSKGEFVRGDLYIFAVDMEGTYLASGANSKLVGQNFYKQYEDAGREVSGDLLELVQKMGKGIVEYEWLNRQTNKLETKFSYVWRVEDIVLGVGFYISR
ncbi:MAG: cache domain-containing protein [Gammaproteobacteria bacterium]|nr:cache domain-containing protein [Gammaproteobacteria bacterium]